MTAHVVVLFMQRQQKSRSRKCDQAPALAGCLGSLPCGGTTLPASGAVAYGDLLSGFPGHPGRALQRQFTWPLAIEVAFDSPFQLGEQGFRSVQLFARLIAGTATALIAVRVVEHSKPISVDQDRSWQRAGTLPLGLARPQRKLRSASGTNGNLRC
jgi:hypothetical protein